MRSSLSAASASALAFASVSLLSFSAFADAAKTVAVTGDALGRLEAVYVAPGGALLRKRENGAGWDAAITLAAAPVAAVALALNCPTAVPASTPPARCANNAGRLEAFFIGASQQMFHAWETTPGSGSWSAPAPFFGTAKNLVVGQNADGRLEVFWVGLDNWIYHAWQTTPNGGTWGVGALTASGASGEGAPTVDPTWAELTLAQNAQGNFDLYYGAATTFDVWHITELVGQPGWTAPAAVPGVSAAHGAAARNLDGRIELFFSDAGGQLVHRWQTAANGASWGFGVFGESAGFIAAAANSDGRLEVLSTAAAPAGNLMDRWENYPNGAVPTPPPTPALPSWGDSTQFGWAAQSVTTALNSDGRLEVFYVRDDGLLYHDYQLQPAQFWSGEYPLPSAIPAAPFSVGAFTTVLAPFDNSTQWSVNDHTFAKDPSGRWRMFGIVAPNPGAPTDLVPAPGMDWMGYAVGSGSLLSPFAYGAPISPQQPYPGAFVEEFTEASNQVLWAPHVIRYGRQSMMFYAAGDRDQGKPNDPAHWSIEVRTSSDLQTWSDPTTALVDDGYQTRDPMVFQDPATGAWILYIASTEDGSGPSHYVVKACAPTDSTLLHWGSCTVVYRDFHVGTDFGPTESPFVVARPVGSSYAYNLFIGPRSYTPPVAGVNWKQPGYVGTDVFRSSNPRQWTNAQYIGHIAAHAAEVIEDGAQWYVSSAGVEQGTNALSVAPLTWLNGN